MKKSIILGLTTAILIGSTAVYASGSDNLENLKNKWMDYKKAQVEYQVKQGDITQDRADEIVTTLKERTQNSDDEFWMQGRRGRFGMMRYGVNRATTYADMQGITVEEAIEQSKNQQKTFIQLAEEAGKLDEFKNKVLEEYKTVIQKKVEDKEIIQQQADELIKTYEDRIEDCDGTRAGLGYRQRCGGFNNGNNKGFQRGRGNRRIIRKAQ